MCTWAPLKSSGGGKWGTWIRHDSLREAHFCWGKLGAEYPLRAPAPFADQQSWTMGMAEFWHCVWLKASIVHDGLLGHVGLLKGFCVPKFYTLMTLKRPCNMHMNLNLSPPSQEVTPMWRAPQPAFNIVLLQLFSSNLGWNSFVIRWS